MKLCVRSAGLLLAVLAVSAARASLFLDTLLKEAEKRYAAAGKTATHEELLRKVTTSLQRASDLLGLDRPEAGNGCEFDFTAFCPEGWAPLGDGVHCELEDGNTRHAGLCGRQLDMRNKSPLDKLSLALTCGLKWPCIKGDIKVPESDAVCPKYWRRDGDECLADSTYAGPCDVKIKLLGKSRAERAGLARECRLEFPVAPELLDANTDWDADCPLGWSLLENGVCAQHTDQAVGSCGRDLVFHGNRDKRDMAKRCGLMWPLKMEQPRAHCPLCWRSDGETGLCIAPASYQGPCQTRLDFAHYTDEGKAIWAYLCGAAFVEGGANSSGAETEKPAAGVTYRNGALDRSLSVLRFDKSVNDPRVMERQLDELHALRKKSSDTLFLKTLDKSIATLQQKLKNAQSHGATLAAPAFLQLASGVSMALNTGPEAKHCPYGWREFDHVCVAGETYARLVPGCKTVHERSHEFAEACRVTSRTDNPNEDFVRSHCPLGWKTRQVYFGGLIRHLCVAPRDFTESQKEECGGGTVDFSARSPAFKRRWAFACGQRFPDLEDTKAPKCAQNFFWKCPAEWEMRINECIAPSHYGGPCPRVAPYSKLANEEAKEDFSRRCGAPWPCLGRCEKDYQSDCPEGWLRSGSVCTATGQQSEGRCGHSIPINGVWSPARKEELEFTCDVHWPCKAL